MYFRLNATPTLLISIFFLLPALSSFAQGDNSCSLPPPPEVFIGEEGDNFVQLSWEEVPGAIGYEVIVLDTETGNLLFLDLVSQPAITIADVAFSETTFIGIASLCSNGQKGIHGYFGYPLKPTTIILQDIVMQFQGEGFPRTLKCEEVKFVVDQTQFSGGLNKNVTVIPPANNQGNKPIEGAIIEVSLEDQINNIPVAKATMLLKSNGSVLNAMAQENVVSYGFIYKLITPAQNNYFNLIPKPSGEFDFFLNTQPPPGSSFKLLVEQRNCPNTNVIKTHKVQTLQIGSIQTDENLSESGKWTSPLEQEVKTPVIFPNPARDFIQVEMAAASQLIIRNSQGQTVYQTQTEAERTTIALNNWPAGLYFLITSDTSGNLFTQRFLKQ